MSVLNLSHSTLDLSGSPVVNGPPKNRQRRNRTYFSDDALDRLEVVFTENPYPDIVQRENLGEEIGVSEARIQVWFQNRRSRNRRNKTKRAKKSSPAASLSSSSLSTSSLSSSSPSPKKTTPVKPKPVTSLPSYGAQQPISPMISPYSYPYMYSPMFMPSMYPMMPMQPQMPSSPLWSPGTPQGVNRYFDFTVPFSPGLQTSPLYLGRYNLPPTPESSPSIVNTSQPTYLPSYTTTLDPNTSSRAAVVTPSTIRHATKTNQEEDDIDVVTP